MHHHFKQQKTLYSIFVGFLSYFCFESKIWLSLLQDSKDIRNIFIQNPDSNFPFPVEKQLLSFQTFVRKFDSAAFLDPPGFPGFLFFQCFQCLPFSHHLSTPLSESFSVPDKKKKFPFHFIPVISLVRGGLEGRWVTQIRSAITNLPMDPKLNSGAKNRIPIDKIKIYTVPTWK